MIGIQDAVSQVFDNAAKKTETAPKIGTAIAELSELQVRVITLLKEADRPLKQSELVAAYKAKAWPIVNEEKLGGVLYSCASHLARTHRIRKEGSAFVSNPA